MVVAVEERRSADKRDGKDIEEIEMKDVENETEIESAPERKNQRERELREPPASAAEHARRCAPTESLRRAAVVMLLPHRRTVAAHSCEAECFSAS